MSEEREAILLKALDNQWRSLRSLGLTPNTRMLIAPAQRLVRQGLIESKLSSATANLVYRRADDCNKSADADEERGHFTGGGTPPRFSLRDGNVVVEHGHGGLYLGPAQAAMQAMATFLAAHDFEERATALPIVTLDEAGKMGER